MKTETNKLKIPSPQDYGFTTVEMSYLLHRLHELRELALALSGGDYHANNLLSLREKQFQLDHIQNELLGCLNDYFILRNELVECQT